MCTSCSCSTPQNITTIETPTQGGGTPATERASYTVSGMTCGHCVASVTEEVAEIDGVSDVLVDLESGSLSFATSQPVSRDAVEAAVREAGYGLA